MTTTSSAAEKKILIVGAGIGGLSAAIHLRLAGYEVTVFEAREKNGGRANIMEFSGCRFDTGPTLLNYPWVFEELFTAADRQFSDYVSLRLIDPSVSFRWPDGEHLSLSSDISVLRREFERIEPGCTPRLMAFLADTERKCNTAFNKLVTHNAANAFSWIARMTPMEMMNSGALHSLNSELRRFFHNPRLREALGSYAMYLGGSPWRLPGLFSILPYGELAGGLWLPEGGIYGLVEAITRLAKELGVEIRNGTPVARILHREGQVAGVALEEGATINCKLVISNVDVPYTWTRLLDPATDPGKRKRKAPRMTPGVVSFYLAVRGGMKGLPHHTIFLPHNPRKTFDDLLVRNIRLPAEPAFYVSLPSRSDPSLAPVGSDAMFILVPAPVLNSMDETFPETDAAAIRSRVVDRLRREGVVWKESDIMEERVVTPSDWRDAFGLYRGSAFGAAHTLLQMGPFRAPNRDPYIRGLYYVGAGTTPGTGVPMVALSGRMTAEKVVKDVP